MKTHNNRTQAANQAAKKHQENMQKSLEHRLQIARIKGDENLLRQLEMEMSQYQDNFRTPESKILFFEFFNPIKALFPQKEKVCR
ncbi:hypothetical protein B6N60_03303 [Richelia sinica FACHB-800]|uniref:Uncharacterized protein n=1 Tax=Richelia sinica FACHB-800 TaxID=1357546 RepID=A0A975Y5U8_9NOST|nr:hypothetical protein [Richelia sinica]MBD2663420.1 hypothetical protein [Richelia sinica FACHB-800]QXE24598.1 hypothetical protein B6N60_03303 [Richelia sinica FACHB-800]